MKFRSTVIPAGNATAVVVPPEVVEGLGAGARPPVRIEINGHGWRSRIMPMKEGHLIGISAANRSASGIDTGEPVEVRVELDTEPRMVELPADLAAALAHTPKASAAFEALPFGLRRKHAAAIEDAKSEATRRRRIAKLLADLGGAGIAR